MGNIRDIIIGIDPGAKGFACVYHTRLNEFTWYPLEDIGAVREMLRGVADVDTVACVEHVGALKGAGSTTTFQFGRNVGTIIGMLMAYGIPYCEVSPQRWQKEMWEPQDKVTIDSKVNTKQTSIRCARRLHPDCDFRRTPKCTKPDDNKVDATLICDYAKRKNL